LQNALHLFPYSWSISFFKRLAADLKRFADSNKADPISIVPYTISQADARKYRVLLLECVAKLRSLRTLYAACQNL
jgi:hypothetical protein